MGGWPLAPLAREGFTQQMISDDIALARRLHRLADADPELEAWTTSLSITTFRYVPEGLQPGLPDTEDYLNELNQELRSRLERGGEAFLSNAVVRGDLPPPCVHRQLPHEQPDIEAVPEIVKRVGRELAASGR